MTFVKKPSKQASRIAALKYAADTLGDYQSHAGAFSDFGFTADEERLARNELSRIATSLKLEAQNLEHQESPPMPKKEPPRAIHFPKKEESQAAQKRRSLTPRIDLFSPITEEVRSALSDGYITADKSLQLARTLIDLPGAKIFPTSVFIKGLKLAAENWTPEHEKQILRAAAVIFMQLNGDDYWINIIRDNTTVFGDWYQQTFDTYHAEQDMTDRQFLFTGKFDGFGRTRCYILSRELGGCPAFSSRYADYAIISDDSVSNRTISSTFTDAIRARTLYGQIKIYTESDFKRLLDEHLPEWEAI